MSFKNLQEDGYLRSMSTFHIFRQLQVQSTGQVIQDWLFFFDILHSLLKVGPVFSNCPKICSFQGVSNCIIKIQLFLRSIYKASIFPRGCFMPQSSLRLGFFFHFLLKYLELVTAYGCFLSLGVLGNQIWAGKTCILPIENSMLNYTQPQEWLWKL